ETLILSGSANINGTGNTLDNMITGNSGNNVLTGGAGNDTLDGGLGADTLYGGAGNDLYLVDYTGDAVIENANEGLDTVQSSISYTLGANVENLRLMGITSINGNGNTLNNVLAGNNGNNILDGSTGMDTLIGGLGNDTYIVDNIGDVVIENTNEGADTVQASIIYTLGANIENLILSSSANLNGTGNALDNLITGNSGSNLLTGGAGNDTLDGGSGADLLYGSTGNDTYIVDNAGDVVTENANEGTDTVQSIITYILGSNVENLILSSSANLNGTGNALDNLIAGNSGNNILTGGAGNDTLNGGAGADSLYGGAGNDVLCGGTGDDTYLYGIGSGNDSIDDYDPSGGSNTLQFQNLVMASVTFTQNGNDLVCTLTQTGENICVSNWTVGTSYQIAQFQFTDGTLNAVQVNQKIGSMAG
ncbi:calcium-binding protein, partial [Propionispora hippei]